MSVTTRVPQYLPAVGDTPTSRDKAIATYFNLGFYYNEILAFLSCFHGVQLSLQQLKRVPLQISLCPRLKVKSLGLAPLNHFAVGYNTGGYKSLYLKGKQIPSYSQIHS